MLYTPKHVLGGMCPAHERAPLMAVMEDLSKEKHRWPRNQAITLLYGWFFLHACNQGCEPLVGCGGRSSHSTGAAEHQWVKESMPYCSNTVLVAPLLLLLMPTIDRAKL